MSGKHKKKKNESTESLNSSWSTNELDLYDKMCETVHLEFRIEVEKRFGQLFCTPIVIENLVDVTQMAIVDFPSIASRHVGALELAMRLKSALPEATFFWRKMLKHYESPKPSPWRDAILKSSIGSSSSDKSGSKGFIIAEQREPPPISEALTILATTNVPPEDYPKMAAVITQHALSLVDQYHKVPKYAQDEFLASSSLGLALLHHQAMKSLEGWTGMTFKAQTPKMKMMLDMRGRTSIASENLIIIEAGNIFNADHTKPQDVREARLRLTLDLVVVAEATRMLNPNFDFACVARLIEFQARVSGKRGNVIIDLQGCPCYDWLSIGTNEWVRYVKPETKSLS